MNKNIDRRYKKIERARQENQIRQSKSNSLLWPLYTTSSVAVVTNFSARMCVYLLLCRQLSFGESPPVWTRSREVSAVGSQETLRSSRGFKIFLLFLAILILRHERSLNPLDLLLVLLLLYARII